MDDKFSISVEAPNKPNKELLTRKSEIVLYTWNSSIKNDEYYSNLETIPYKPAVRLNDINYPNRVKYEADAQSIILQKKSSRKSTFESCLINNKSEEKIQPLLREFLIIEKAPKYYTTLDKICIDAATLEITRHDYLTDSFKQANNRKIKALDRFCSFYQPHYKKRNVSLFFVTLTSYGNHAQNTIKQFIDSVKFRLKYNDSKVLGYIWTLEVSEHNHAHYHLCFATDRLNLQGAKLPDYLKFESLWGARTETTFVKKNVRHYLAKYFAKHNYRLFEHRSYGTSQRLNLPTLKHKTCNQPPPQPLE